MSGTDFNGRKIGFSMLLSHLTVAAIIWSLTLLIPRVTSVRTKPSNTNTRRNLSSNTGSMGYPTSTSYRYNATSSIFAPNDPYRWKEQLMIKQEEVRQGRQLNVEYRSVLVIRIVTDGDSDGNIIENEINNVLFRGSPITVQRQMQLCSGGKIIFQPSNDGIITVRMNNLGGRVEAYTTAVAEKVMKEHYRTTNTLMGYKEQLRKVADHVLIILPKSFPANTFVANAEIGRPICVFSFEWLASMSAYMHEMGHNLNQRHSGRGSSEPYGDNTGYMGVSNPKAYGPEKCYNAAQHWNLNFYENHRVSLLNIGLSSTPILLKLAAFVDHEKIGSDYTVLVQVSSSTYIQFNRAKSYNVGTEMMMDQVVVINDGGDKTILIAGLDADSNVLSLSSVSIQVCSINIGDSSGIDYAVVAVATGNNGRMCDGALVSTAKALASIPPPSNSPVTIPPTSPPTHLKITDAPTNLPISDAPIQTPTTNAPTQLQNTNEPTHPPILFTATPQEPPTFLPTGPQTTFLPTSSPTEYYISSPHPTDQGEKEYMDQRNSDGGQTPIFTSFEDTDSNGNTVTRSSKASSPVSSGRSPVILPGMIALVGVMILAALVAVRRMAIHRHYLSKPLRTRDDDLEKDDKDPGSMSTFMEDVEGSTHGFLSKINHLLFDYEIDLGGDENNTTTPEIRR